MSLCASQTLSRPAAPLALARRPARLAAHRPIVRAQAQQEQGPKASHALSAVLSAVSLLAAQQASAATEIAQLAKSDSRPLIIATLFIPVVGWVGFNILGPALNQAANMSAGRGPGKGTKR